MGDGTCTNRAVVLSDTHFGVVHDPTEKEETNLADLINLLDLIKDEIKPKTIILLGDIFDLWRVEFKYAWDNADDIKFFERLTNYVREHQDEGAELIYVLGNHDHFLQEIRWAINTKERYNKIIEGKNSDENEDEGIQNEEGDGDKQKCGEDNKSYIMTEEIDIDIGLDYVKFFYPHYKKKFENIGMVYFDHGHYNTKEQRQSKKLLARIIKLLSKFLSKSKIHERLLSKCISSEEIYQDLEANLSSVYSLLYYSKLDDVVRTARDFIWRTYNKRWHAIIAIIVFLAQAGLYLILPDNNLGDLNPADSLSPVGLFALFSGIVALLLPKMISIILPGILTGTISSMRNKTVDNVLPEIVANDVCIEMKGYTYLNLMVDQGNCGDKIQSYIFGHTHKAGRITDSASQLDVYNCGSWVKDEAGESCTNSFIIIDPDVLNEDKIKIYHMENMKKVACEFDKNGRCKYECKK